MCQSLLSSLMRTSAYVAALCLGYCSTSNSFQIISSTRHQHPLSAEKNGGDAGLRVRLAFPELADGRVERLFSNIDYAGEQEEEGCILPETFRHSPTDLFSAVALIGGTAVGSGALALPARTLEAGFLPSTALMIALWLLMTGTGLLVAECSVNSICRQGEPGLGLLNLAKSSLGQTGATAVGLVYLLLHYCLLTAYIAQAGGYVSGLISPGSESSLLGSALFTATVGGGMAFSSEEAISKANNILVAIVIASFAVIAGVGSGSVQPELLMHADLLSLPSAIPVVLVALVYHNVVPVITTQLEGDIRRIRMAIVLGNAIPLALFLIWNSVILGSITVEDAGGSIAGAAAGSGVFDPVQALMQQAGGVQGSSPLGPAIAVFSMTAITTSFIGFVYGLVDFFGDALSANSGNSQKERLPLFALTLLPPFLVASIDPNIFFRALDAAGTWGITSLFVLLPPLLAWRQRYVDTEPLATLPLLPGGKATLLGIGGVGVAVILQNLLTTVNY